MNQDLRRRVGEAVFRDCFAVKPKEKILIVCDERKLNEATLFSDLAGHYASNVQIVELKGMTENAQEPPKEICALLCAADVALLVTTFSLSHTAAREEACECGTRIASLPGITLEMIERTLSGNYGRIAEQSERVAEKLSKGRQIEILSPGGTKLTLSVAGRSAIPDAGQLAEPGSFSNLPAGEAFLAPVEGTTEGVLVIDGGIADIELDEPVRITLQQGKAIELEGGGAAKELKAAMQSVGQGAFLVAELGIGTNPQAIVDSDILEAEKVLGTCHIAFGNNAHFGGIIDVPFHTDGLVLRPTVLIDGVPLMQDGVLTET